jgi:hypothetical protein
MNAINAIGSICSIVGLVISAYVAWTIRKIEIAYVRHALIQECASKLSASLKNMNQFMRRSDESRLRQELQKCRVILSEQGVFGNNDTDAANTVAAIEQLLSIQGGRFLAAAAAVVGQISGQLARLELQRTKSQWSRKNVSD